MNPRLLIAIDPGASGAIAWRDARIGLPAFPTAQTVNMPQTERDLWDTLVNIVGMVDETDVAAVVERLGGMPREADGRARQSPTTMFKMGTNYGLVRMALCALTIPYDDALPAVWQKPFGLARRPHESATAKKNRHKAKAQQLFPRLKVTLKNCDALLLLEHLSRQRWPKPASE